MRYFTEKEFKNCTPSCSMSEMDADFLLRLDRIRYTAGIPLVLNCAYRSKEWDIKQGRSGNSAHCKGKGADIRCNTSSNRMKIVKAALDCGITRIGIGKTFVHIDADESLPQDVIWHYYQD